MKFGFLRAACASPRLDVCDCFANAERICAVMRNACDEGAAVVVFPELSITAYTCGDLFLQRSLQQNALAALERIAHNTAGLPVLALVGLPFAHESALYNAAAFVHKGKILALAPKTFIPNYGEFYEKRYFASARNLARGLTARISGAFPRVPFGADIIVADSKNPDVAVAAEICEDLWTPAPPSVDYALCGATIVANLSASNEVTGKAAYRRQLAVSQSGRLSCAYLYANAGRDESTTDMVFGAHNIIAENGALLAESELFADGLLLADIDTERLTQERRRMVTFADSACARMERAARDNAGSPCRVIHIELCDDAGGKTIGFGGARKAALTGGAYEKILRRHVEARPFVPHESARRAERCKEVIALQAQGLAKRLRHTKAQSAVIGISGGLDSTLALLVTKRAFELCAIPCERIHALTMPCFGTTPRTRRNAENLARALGASFREISIERAVRVHFADIAHNESERDVVYENAQARERTQVLMDVANKTGGIVIGTGDLSEHALGWATYNGDHMSMYAVNASIPKTLVRYLVAWFMDEARDSGARETLRDILDTPVSPELVPGTHGEIAQKTEDIVGPYELHDFFLYYVLRWGFAPSKIYFLAQEAFGGAYESGVIRKWLRVFYERFFAQQFKRSCLPDGAKVGTVSLSPRGDWRMPSDASAEAWLKEIDGLE